MADIIGRIWFAFDRSYGHQLLLDDRFLNNRNIYSVSSALNSTTRDITGEQGQTVYAHLTTLTVVYPQEKQPYFDLLRCCVDAVPRCMPAGLATARVVEMLCRYTAHVDPDLALAASRALIRLGKQRGGFVVVSGMSKFIGRIGDRFTELLVGSFAPNAHADDFGLLPLYVQLLELWSDEMLLAPSPAEASAGDGLLSMMYLDSPDVWNLIEETEANGLILLCSHSPLIRKYAVRVLRLAVEVEQQFEEHAFLRKQRRQDQQQGHEKQPSAASALSKLSELERQPHVSGANDPGPTHGPLVGAGAREKRGLGNDIAEMRLRDLAESEQPEHQQTWHQHFIELVNACFERCPITVALCRNTACSRLTQMQMLVALAADMQPSVPPTPTSATSSGKPRPSLVTDRFIDQWSVYLRFACATMTVTAPPATPTSIYAPLGMNGPSPVVLVQEIGTARDLFRAVLPYMICEHHMIRDAVVDAFGHVNRNVFTQLLDELQPFVRSVLEDPHSAYNPPPSAGLGRRNRRFDRLRTDITHIYQMMSRFLRYDEYLRHADVVPRMAHWLKETRSFLSDPEVQIDWEFQELRRYFAGLAEHLCWHLPRLTEPSRAMPFEFRLSLYRTLEEWCGHGRHRELTRRREHSMLRSVLSQCKNVMEQGSITPALEKQLKSTEVAALRAMAACCRGPLSMELSGQEKTVVSFDLEGIHTWIESVFANHERRLHSIARTALESLLTFNSDKPEIFDTIIRRCYMLSDPDVNTQGYFLALIDILTRARSYPCEVHVILGLALFKVGDPDREVRRTAVRLLHVLEERFLLDSSVIEFEVALYSNLTTIYKQAQYALSARLAQRHPEITYEVLSEIMVRLEAVSAREAQREMVISVLPWLVNVELAMDPDDETEVAISSHIVLNNLFYLTVKFGDVFYKELEKAWEQLVVGERAYNARVVIVYLLHLGLEKRNPGFITYAKRVVVYLGRATAREVTINALMDEIAPRALVPEKRMDIRQYDKVPRVRVADVDEVLGAYAKRPEFSRAQLATVLLVDLAIEAGPSLLPHLPTLLHACAIQFDHNILVIAEQMRLLLGHLVCSVFFGRPAGSPAGGNSSQEQRQILQRMGVSNYASRPARIRNTSVTEPLVTRLVRLFAHEDPEIGQRWGEMALHWGTQCPLRKAACSSFRVFRMLAPHFNEAMLAEILRRLSNTVSDQSEEIQEFAVEILITLKSMLEPLTAEHILAFPEAFWASVAILYTGSRNEYAMGLEMLGPMLERLDFDDPSTQTTLSDNFPAGWNAEFDGLLPLLAKGLRCQETEPRCLRMMNRLILVGGDALLDPTESRYLFAVLANLPWFSRTVEEMSYDDRVVEVAGNLAKMAERNGQDALRRTLDSLARRRFRPKDDFIRQIYLALKDVYFPRYEWHALTFIAELLANQTPWYKRSVLHILRTLLSFIDLRRGDGQDEPSGTEIVIAPLLRLLPTEYADDALEVL
ncbi:cell morphogenesis C-terminal-domain-containing protein, partial [Thamnocephalis sphaerospora]